MLYPPSTSDYDDMHTGVSKSTHLETTIKRLTKEKIHCHGTERNLISKGQNIRAKISIMEKNYTKINERPFRI